MANINTISPDGGTTVYDIEDTPARSGINSLTPRVGIAEGKITTLQEQMLSVQNSLGGLGTASTKNSTSVVTESSDLVESGAVKDIVGWGNKNLFDPANIRTEVTATYVPLYVGSGVFTMSTNMPINTQGEANLFILAGNVSTGASTTTNGVWSGQTRTVTAIDGYVTVASRNTDGVNPVNYNHQLEKGSTATAYEPYHPSVSDSLAEKADNSVIGTVEGANASKAWSVGEHFISGGQFKEVTQPIASGGAINDSNTVDRPIADCLVRLLPIFNNAGSHNGIFRGKNLGSSLTTAQKTAIANGSFEDLYIGDYWEINGIKWRIAHFDYWYRSGDTQCTTHHVVVVPDNVLNYKIMNDKVDNKDVTTGAYINSKMYQSQIADARNIVKTAFGENNILTHREWFANDTNVGGWETGGAWYDSQIDLMNEIMVYGSNIFHNCVNGTSLPGGNYTIDKVQLALFRLDQSYTIALNPAGTDRTYWWLRDVCNATNFAFVGRYGNANDYGASSSYGVRPAFAIK